MNCYCGSQNVFAKCCEPFLSGQESPKTAEQLMRSRYSAYVVGNIDYIKNTLAPEAQSDFDYKSAKDWSQQSKWLGLQIIKTEKGQAGDQTGVVEFVASFEFAGEKNDHHEISQFRKDNRGHWLYVDGEQIETKPQTIQREGPKVGRNDPCPCGSQKKYKKCCGA